MLRFGRLRTRLSILTLSAVALAACSDEPTTPDGDNLVVPTVYSFESRFDAGTSSVSYSGQTVRNLLLQDLKIAIDRLGTAGATPTTLDALLDIYAHDDADNLSTLTTTGSLPPEETKYSNISTGKNLTGKISPATLIGTSTTADDMVRAWLDSIARFSQDPSRIGTPMAYTTDAGQDLTQLVNKTLLGAVVYYQGTGVYLDGLLDRNNTERSGPENPYTSMEHGFDEAFGYYGAARDYDNYSDADLAGSVDMFAKDTDGNGKIDFQSEYNFGFSRNAGKRDKGSATGTDMTAKIFEAFRRGRALISSSGSRDEIVAERKKIAEIWEQVIAATAIHYANEVISDMGALTGESNPANSATLNKHWGELKGFLWSLQYNPLGRVTATDLQRWHGLVGEAPRYDPAGSSGSNGYIQDLRTVRDELGIAVGFSTQDVEVW